MEKLKLLFLLVAFSAIGIGVSAQNKVLQVYKGGNVITTMDISQIDSIKFADKENLIYGETFGTTAVQNGTTWPSVADYDGYDKAGAGAAQVICTAIGGAVTVRTNAPSNYSGASGSCNAMMAAAGASLLINDIAVCSATTLSLSFGSNETDAVLAVAYKINGTSQWVSIPYSKSTAGWELVSDLTINLPAGTNTIKLKFTAGTTDFGTRVDDILITTSDVIGAPVIDPDPDTPTETGDGTQAKPFTVAEGIAKQGTNDVWVKGYIVGCVKNGATSVTSADDVFIGVTSGFNLATNVLIADNAGEKDYTKCIVVNLPAGTTLRTSVNLSDNPGNIGKLLNVKGNLRAYFGLPGSRDNTGVDFELEGGTGPTPGGDILNVPFITGGQGGFTIYNVLGDQIWNLQTQYGMVISGFANSRNYQNEDWLISPAMNLTGKTNVVLTFDHARGPAASMSVPLTGFTLWISNNYTDGAPSTAAWTQLSIPVHGTIAWGYVSSGNISIPGDKLTANTRFAFKYICSDSESAQWEIKNVIVK